MIEILSSGFANTVQDLGRPGFLDQGIACGGAMDREALIVANVLVGNADRAAALEIANFPFRIRFGADILLAITGARAEAVLSGNEIASWSASLAHAGDELRIEIPPAGGRLYLAFAGGIDVPRLLYSAATDLKGGYGGFHGRGLMRGDRLRLAKPGTSVARAGSYRLDEMFFGRNEAERLKIRAMPGAECDWLAAESRDMFFSMPLTVSRENNRQGMRLDCDALRFAKRKELFSHGIMPGTVQVPPSGQPVIQLAEANTCGGYPKIAHIVPSELWKLAQARAGDALTFVEVSRDEALQVMNRSRRALQQLKNLMPLAQGWASDRGKG